ncbi:MAG TPA: type II toxin-antitoxin system prevent-host-death family antitoxin [Solirubrobacterales bacterium]|nr:type II toxin-antitoxin system prevent-host-death family antitoxin [Solirubrobacterales bacterium]
MAWKPSVSAQRAECYDCRTIVEVATRELRNKTADLLRRVEAGESMVITVRGKPVATLSPYRDDTPRWMPRDELIELLKTHSADPGLRDDLKRLAGETTDEDKLNRLW